jgi:hypothetical protein
LSDPDQSRPSLPDPQRDRHVAFVGDGPEGDPDSNPGGTAPRESSATSVPSGSTWATALPVATTLPAEAWAPRTSTSEASPSAPSWSRDPGPAPSVLTTPPVRPATGRRRPRWLALLLVPLLIGLANNQDDGSQTDGCTISDDTGTYECSSYDGMSGGTSGMGAEQGVRVWTDDVTESTKPLAPLLKGSPKVSPVPADATVLRVEIVSSTDGVASRGDSPSAPLQTQVDTSAGGMPIDAWDQGTPHALDVHLDERPTDLQVSVTVTAGSGTVQCRVYAGSTLVAVDTSTATAMCTPEL